MTVQRGILRKVGESKLSEKRTHDVINKWLLTKNVGIIQVALALF